MSSDEEVKTDVEADAINDILGPPPAEADSGAMPSRVLETVLLRFLARIIHADGEIHSKEMSTMISLAQKLEFDGDEAKRILDDEFERKSNCAVLATQIPNTQRQIEAYAMGCLMSCADGDVPESERALLADFARGAGISDEVAEKILVTMSNQAQTAIENHRK